MPIDHMYPPGLIVQGEVCGDKALCPLFPKAGQSPHSFLLLAWVSLLLPTIPQLCPLIHPVSEDAYLLKDKADPQAHCLARPW